jgi:hypothetical protein
MTVRTGVRRDKAPPFRWVQNPTDNRPRHGPRVKYRFTAVGVGSGSPTDEILGQPSRRRHGRSYSNGPDSFDGSGGHAKSVHPLMTPGSSLHKSTDGGAQLCHPAGARQRHRLWRHGDHDGHGGCRIGLFDLTKLSIGQGQVLGCLRISAYHRLLYGGVEFTPVLPSRANHQENAAAELSKT